MRNFAVVAFLELSVLVFVLNVESLTVAAVVYNYVSLEFLKRSVVKKRNHFVAYGILVADYTF